MKYSVNGIERDDLKLTVVRHDITQAEYSAFTNGNGDYFCGHSLSALGDFVYVDTIFADPSKLSKQAQMEIANILQIEPRHWDLDSDLAIMLELDRIDALQKLSDVSAHDLWYTLKEMYRAKGRSIRYLDTSSEPLSADQVNRISLRIQELQNSTT